MICEACHGTGYLPEMNPSRPCPDCQGCGVAYCCEGSARFGQLPPPHVSTPDCWCRPEEVEPGVFVHRQAIAQ
jgi:hypothetical protein